MPSYKMPKISNSGINGMAQIRMGTGAKAGKVQAVVTYKENGEDVQKTFIFDKANCPKYVKSGLFRVRLSSAGDKMFQCIPADEQLVCQFMQIAHKEGELPAPKLVSGGKYEDYMQFVLVFKVVSGEYEGLEIPAFLRYNFEPFQDEGQTYTGLSHPKSKYTAMLEKVLDSLGVMEYGPIKFEDNLLPKIAKRAQRAVAEKNQTVLVTLSDGYVSNVKPVVTDGWNDDEGDDDQGDKDVEGFDHADAVEAKAQSKNAPVSEPDPDEDDGFDAKEKSSTDDDIPWDEE